jgi:hypothetical protein
MQGAIDALNFRTLPSPLFSMQQESCMHTILDA